MILLKIVRFSRELLTASFQEKEYNKFRKTLFPVIPGQRKYNNWINKVVCYFISGWVWTFRQDQRTYTRSERNKVISVRSVSLPLQ